MVPDLSAVLVPVLPAEPAPYSHSWLVIALLVLTGAAMIFFTGHFVNQIGRREPRGETPRWGHLLGSAGVGLAAILVAGALITVSEGRVDEARTEYFRLERAATEQVVTQLESTYGVEFVEYPLIPLEEGRGLRNVLRLPEGDEERCEVSVLQGQYEIRCGGEGTDQGEVLPPAAVSTS